MSDNILHLVPPDPEVTPPEADTAPAAAILRAAFPHSDGVDVERHDVVQFFDSAATSRALGARNATQTCWMMARGAK